MTRAQVHVVYKANIADHHAISLLPSPQPALRDGHVRTRTILISLTSNNLSYARLGSVLHWFDAYPLPLDLPEPYNDGTRYGICPAWGYSEVLESKVSGIEPGTLIWGFWPTHNLPVDLRLVPADVQGHWIEISDHRKRLMNSYQRYVVPDKDTRWNGVSREEIEEMAWRAALNPVWEAGFLLNSAVFGSPPVHPAAAGKWDENDADLSSAVVVSLSASGKTARGFAYGLIKCRSPGTEPLALLAITSMSSTEFLPKASFPTRTTSYEAMTGSDTLDWLASSKPRNTIIADFGGRGDALSRLLKAFEKHLDSVEIVVIGVGSDVSLQTSEQVGQSAQRNAAMSNRVQMNTSPLKDAIMERDGAEVYYNHMEDAWDGFVKSQLVSDLKLEMRKGIEGSDGFEGGWTTLCAGHVPGDIVMVYEV